MGLFFIPSRVFPCFKGTSQWGSNHQKVVICVIHFKVIIILLRTSDRSDWLYLDSNDNKKWGFIISRRREICYTYVQFWIWIRSFWISYSCFHKVVGFLNYPTKVISFCLMSRKGDPHHKNEGRLRSTSLQAYKSILHHLVRRNYSELLKYDREIQKHANFSQNICFPAIITIKVLTLWKASKY